MMQLLQQHTLQSFSDFAFRRIDSRLSQKARRIDSGLGQQLAETRDFRFEGIFLETLVVTRHNHARVRTALRHPTRNSRGTADTKSDCMLGILAAAATAIIALAVMDLSIRSTETADVRPGRQHRCHRQFTVFARFSAI